MTRRRLLLAIALASIVASLAYPLVALLLGLQVEGYSHLRDQISELGRRELPHAPILNTVLVIDAALVIALAVAVRLSIGEGRGSRWAVALIATFGGALLLGGLFPCDADCLPTTFSGWVHALNALPAAVATIGAPFAVSRLFARDPRLALFASGAFVLGVLVVVSVLAAFTLFPLLDLGGLGQRLVLAWQVGFFVLVGGAVVHVNLQRPERAAADGGGSLRVPG